MEWEGTSRQGMEECRMEGKRKGAIWRWNFRWNVRVDAHLTLACSARVSANECIARTKVNRCPCTAAHSLCWDMLRALLHLKVGTLRIVAIRIELKKEGRKRRERYIQSIPFLHPKRISCLRIRLTNFLQNSRFHPTGANKVNASGYLATDKQIRGRLLKI